MGGKLWSASLMTGISDFALDILLRQKDGGQEEWIIRQVQMGKELKQSQPAVFSMCMSCIFMRAARFCVLYAFCCFLPSRSPAMGNLIKVLGKDLENCPHFFLDFESKWARGVCTCLCAWIVSARVCGAEVLSGMSAGWGQVRYIWMWAAELLMVSRSVVGVVCHYQMLFSLTLSDLLCEKVFYLMTV